MLQRPRTRIFGGRETSHSVVPRYRFSKWYDSILRGARALFAALFFPRETRPAACFQPLLPTPLDS